VRPSGVVTAADYREDTSTALEAQGPHRKKMKRLTRSQGPTERYTYQQLSLGSRMAKVDASIVFRIAPLAASKGLAAGMRRAGLGLFECGIANSDAAGA
jgi:hypothetical protein